MLVPEWRELPPPFISMKSWRIVLPLEIELGHNVATISSEIHCRRIGLLGNGKGNRVLVKVCCINYAVLGPWFWVFPMLCTQAGGRCALSWPRVRPSWTRWLYDLSRKTGPEGTLLFFYTFNSGPVPNRRPSLLSELGLFSLPSFRAEDVKAAFQWRNNSPVDDVSSFKNLVYS